MQGEQVAAVPPKNDSDDGSEGREAVDSRAHAPQIHAAAVDVNNADE